MKLTPEERAEAEKTWGMAFDENGFGTVTMATGDEIAEFQADSSPLLNPDSPKPNQEKTVSVDGLEIPEALIRRHLKAQFPHGLPKDHPTKGFGQYQK